MITSSALKRNYPRRSLFIHEVPAQRGANVSRSCLRRRRNYVIKQQRTMMTIMIMTVTTQLRGFGTCSFLVPSTKHKNESRLQHSFANFNLQLRRRAAAAAVVRILRPRSSASLDGVKCFLRIIIQIIDIIYIYVPPFERCGAAATTTLFCNMISRVEFILREL